MKQHELLDFSKQVQRYPESFRTRFLTLAEQQVVIQARPEARFEGGYDGAELKRALTKEDAEIVTLEISVVQTNKVIEHRHVMGSLLALGLERETFGDIIMGEPIFTFVVAELADFVITNLQVSGQATSIKRSTTPVAHTSKLEEKTVIVTSARVDNFIASIYNVARSQAQELLTRGYVRVNGVEMTSQTKVLQEGDILSVRTKGKAKILAFTGTSKKDKLIVTIGRYVD
jgi:RNA-binding protein YlmH